MFDRLAERLGLNAIPQMFNAANWRELMKSEYDTLLAISV